MKINLFFFVADSDPLSYYYLANLYSFKLQTPFPNLTSSPVGKIKTVTVGANISNYVMTGNLYSTAFRSIDKCSQTQLSIFVLLRDVST